jgi:hypothetical protein
MALIRRSAEKSMRGCRHAAAQTKDMSQQVEYGMLLPFRRCIVSRGSVQEEIRLG